MSKRLLCSDDAPWYEKIYEDLLCLKWRMINDFLLWCERLH
jgi:hypothetical protein